MPQTISTSAAKLISDQILPLMQGEDWIATKQELTTIIEVYLPKLQSQRCDRMELRYSLPTEMVIPTASLIDEDIDNIARLLHGLELECQEEYGGWLSPVDVRRRISTLHHSLQRIA